MDLEHIHGTPGTTTEVRNLLDTRQQRPGGQIPVGVQLLGVAARAHDGAQLCAHRRARSGFPSAQEMIAVQPLSLCTSITFDSKSTPLKSTPFLPPAFLAACALSQLYMFASQRQAACILAGSPAGQAVGGAAAGARHPHLPRAWQARPWVAGRLAAVIAALQEPPTLLQSKAKAISTVSPVWLSAETNPQDGCST